MNTTMRAIYQQCSNQAPILKDDIPIPKPISGQVLIKVEYASIHSFDKQFINGTLPCSKQSNNCVPGFEGSGIVVESGGGILGWKLKGNRVAFFTEHVFGAYGEYAIADSQYCMELPKNISFQEGCCSFLNPIAVMFMLERVNGGGVIQTGGSNHMGRMIMRYFQERGLNVLNIVRKQQEEQLLREEGAKLLLNVQDDDFDGKLKLMAESYGCNLLLDCFGGKELNRIMRNMPYQSKCVLYGNLSQEDNFSVGGLIEQQKSVEGYNLVKIRFYLIQELKEKNLLELQLMYKEIMRNVNGCFKTLPTQCFSMEQFNVEGKQRGILKINI